MFSPIFKASTNATLFAITHPQQIVAGTGTVLCVIGVSRTIFRDPKVAAAFAIIGTILTYIAVSLYNLGELKFHIAKLEKEGKALAGNVTKLGTQVDGLETTRTALNTEVEKAGKVAEQLKVEVKDLNVVKGQISNEVGSLNEASASLKTEIAGLESSKKQLDNSLLALNIQVKGLEDRQSEAQTLLDDLKSERKSISVEVEGFKGQRDELDKSIKTLEDHLNGLDKNKKVLVEQTSLLAALAQEVTKGAAELEKQGNASTKEAKESIATITNNVERALELTTIAIDKVQNQNVNQFKKFADALQTDISQIVSKQAAELKSQNEEAKRLNEQLQKTQIGLATTEESLKNSHKELDDKLIRIEAANIEHENLLKQQKDMQNRILTASQGLIELVSTSQSAANNAKDSTEMLNSILTNLGQIFNAAGGAGGLPSFDVKHLQFPQPVTS